MMKMKMKMRRKEYKKSSWIYFVGLRGERDVRDRVEVSGACVNNAGVESLSAEITWGAGIARGGQVFLGRMEIINSEKAVVSSHNQWRCSISTRTVVNTRKYLHT